MNLFEVTTTPVEQPSFSLASSSPPPPASYTGIYSMHKYWAKKPYNVVRAFILRYTQPGEIVLDPFCGSGVTAVEAVLAQRKAVAADVNPIATFITRSILLPIDPHDLQAYFGKIRECAAHEINGLYLTRCLQCGGDAVGTHYLWNNSRLQKIWYTCPCCGNRKGVKPPDETDIHRVSVAEAEEITYFYPQVPLYENSRINVRPGTRVSDLFTKRNLLALSLLLHTIEQIPDMSAQDMFKFIFTASLAQASQMVFVVRQRGKIKGGMQEIREREEVGSWVAGFWVPRERFEINVWRCFENRFRKVLRGKLDAFQRLREAYSEAATFEELYQGKNLLIRTLSATDLSILPDESVDYVFTDPPHGDRIPYLELSAMWMAWLRMDANYEEEIVVSDAKQRCKDIKDYRIRLAQAFREMHRVLKKGGFMSVAFNSWDDEIWHAFTGACQDVGFEIVEVVPTRYSANSVMQDSRKGGLRGDFIVTFRKSTRPVSTHHLESLLASIKKEPTVVPSRTFE